MFRSLENLTSLRLEGEDIDVDILKTTCQALKPSLVELDLHNASIPINESMIVAIKPTLLRHLRRFYFLARSFKTHLSMTILPSCMIRTTLVFY